MPTDFDPTNHPIKGLMIGEFHIVRLGPHPGDTARIAYTAHREGTTVGGGMFWTAWSEETQHLIEMLLASAERDVITMLSGTLPEDLNGSVRGGEDDLDEDDGLSFG